MKIVDRLRVEGQLNGLAPDVIDDLKMTVAVSPTVPQVTTLTCEPPDQGALVRLMTCSTTPACRWWRSSASMHSHSSAPRC